MVNEKKPSPKVMCAWHPKYFGSTLVMQEGSLPVSDGMCPECFQKADAEVTEYFQKSREAQNC